VLGLLRKNAEAVTSHEWAIKISPNYSLALANQCETLNRLGKAEDALASCDKALQGDGKWDGASPALAWDQRGNALARQGKYEEALASHDRAIALKPDYPEAWNNRSVTLWYMGRYEEALAASDRAINHHPDYSQGWYNRGRYLRR
jgi:tetratricopeptide (TPR) repeat protein